MSFKSSFVEYKASKTTLFWTAVSASALTMIVGFSGLGWVTTTTSEEVAQEAVDSVRRDFTTAICMQEFFYSEDPLAEQAELKEMRSYTRENHVIEHGWVSPELAGSKRVEKQAARACVEEILNAEIEVVDYNFDESEDELGDVEVQEPDLEEEVIETHEAESAVIEVEPATEEAEAVEAEVKPSISLPTITQVPAQ